MVLCSQVSELDCFYLRISGGGKLDIVILGRFAGWIYDCMCILSDINDLVWVLALLFTVKWLLMEVSC